MTTSFNCAGITLDLTNPVVMGILNMTPDSFYDGNATPTLTEQVRKIEQMIEEGASIIDVGAVSTRPGAEEVDEDEELKRLLPLLSVAKKQFPGVIFSVDTFRSEVARRCIDLGVGIINDIYGGTYDDTMFALFTTNEIGYVLMHMQGTPATMQLNPFYGDVVEEVIGFFTQQLSKLDSNFLQVILDPGFGFGKGVEHNHSLLSHLKRFQILGYPILAGVSRKSMICKVLEVAPKEALNGTTVLNTLALLNGATILRVHDVKAAMEAIKLVKQIDY